MSLKVDKNTPEYWREKYLEERRLNQELQKEIDSIDDYYMVLINEHIFKFPTNVH